MKTNEVQYDEKEKEWSGEEVKGGDEGDVWFSMMMKNLKIKLFFQLFYHSFINFFVFVFEKMNIFFFIPTREY